MLEQSGLTSVMTRPQAADAVVAWVGTQARTRGDFLRDVAAWACAMQARSGARVALYTDDSYTFATALMGAWQAGKTVVLPGDVQPHTLQRLSSTVDFNAGDLPQGVRPDASAELPNWPFVKLDAGRHRLVVQTSGSSGDPVDIDKQLAQLDAEVNALEAQFGHMLRVPGLRVHATVSHQHIYGLLFQVLWPLSIGRAFVSGRLEYPESVLAALSKGPAVLVASPAHLKRFPEHLAWEQVREHLAAIFSSGGPLLPQASHEVFRLTGYSPIEVYGSSETGGIAWRQRTVHGDIWTPFSVVALRQIDGLLEVSSPYLPDEHPYLTSDLVHLRDDGRFELLGRSDRIVKIEEKRVSLAMLERTLLGLSEVGEVRVFPLKVSDRVRLAAVVVLSETGREILRLHGKSSLTDRFRRSLLEVVERLVLPRRWRFVEALPTNAQGKVTEGLLAQLFSLDRPALQWISRSPTQAEAALDIAPELSAFEGHFPQAPLLPGVVQLDWAIELGRECFAPAGAFAGVDQLKFHVPIFPGAQVRLLLQWDAVQSTLSFQYQSSQHRHASGKVKFHA